MSAAHIAIRRQLLSNGYAPLPLLGKRPQWNNWNRGPITVERLNRIEAAFPDHTNTGILTGSCVATDVDLTNAAHASEVEKIITAILGDTPLRRVGSKGCLLCYRNETPIRKITIGTAKKRLVEFLGSGQQFVAFGTHPDTGLQYDWTNDWEGGDPAQTRLVNLPAVTPEQLHDAAKAVAERLTALGYDDVEASGAIESPSEKAVASIASGKPVTQAIIEAMLRCINPASDRHAWLTVCGALVSAPVSGPHFDGLALFVAWSRGDFHGGIAPANFKGAEDCEAQWCRDVEKLHVR